MKRYIIPSGALMCALLALPLASCGHKNKKEADEGPRPIYVAEAFTDSVVLHKSYPGYLSAGNTAEIVAQVNGRLQSQNYKPGTYVSKGQVLFTIDPTLYRDAVSRAEASLASAKSSRDYALSHYNAVKKALEADAVSKMEVLSAESNYEQAEANIKDCQAALNTARTQLGYCTVTAPFSGYISDSYLDVGNYVSGEGAPVTLAKLYDNSVFSAVFEIEDSQYEMMVGRDGGTESPLYRAIPLQFRNELPHEYTADLSYEAPNVAKGTGTVKLKGKVKNIDGELKDGMYVVVSLPYGVLNDAILVKDAAIGTDQRGQYLYMVNDSNKVVYTPVETGELFRDSLRVIMKGIGKGDKYVTKALLTVRNGEEVKPIVTK